MFQIKDILISKSLQTHSIDLWVVIMEQFLFKLLTYLMPISKSEVHCIRHKNKSQNECCDIEYANRQFTKTRGNPFIASWIVLSNEYVSFT